MNVHKILFGLFFLIPNIAFGNYLNCEIGGDESPMNLSWSWINNQLIGKTSWLGETRTEVFYPSEDPSIKTTMRTVEDLPIFNIGFDDGSSLILSFVDRTVVSSATGLTDEYIGTFPCTGSINFDGEYVLEGHSCDDPGLFGRTIKGKEFFNDESFCELNFETNIRGMDAVLFDSVCSSEGEEYSQSTMIIKSAEPQGSIYIVNDGWSGHFLRCN